MGKRPGRRSQPKAAKKRERAARREQARTDLPPAPARPDSRAEFFALARDYTPLIGVETIEGRFVVATNDAGAGWGLFAEQGRPEFRVLALAVSLIKDLSGGEAIAGKQFIDVGANIGTEAISALGSHRFGSAICCEPETQNVTLLRANLALNELADRARVIEAAISNVSGRSELVVLEDRRGRNWLALDRGMFEAAERAASRKRAADPTMTASRRGGPRPEPKLVEIDVVTLDQLAEEGIIDADSVGMLWMDTEGHEGHVLDGASELVSRSVPIVTEFNPPGLTMRGNAARLYEIVAEHYTQFADVRRGSNRGQFRAVSELTRLGDELLEADRFTDILLVRE